VPCATLHVPLSQVATSSWQQGYGLKSHGMTVAPGHDVPATGSDAGHGWVPPVLVVVVLPAAVVVVEVLVPLEVFMVLELDPPLPLPPVDDVVDPAPVPLPPVLVNALPPHAMACGASASTAKAKVLFMMSSREAKTRSLSTRRARLCVARTTSFERRLVRCR
jgi:hypothetical protein